MLVTCLVIQFSFKCLSDGCLKDMGPPYDLLQDPKTVLYSMVKKLNREEARYLYEISKSRGKRIRHVTEVIDEN